VQTDETEDWPPIELAWRQKLAAFWSIFWPSWLASTFGTLVIATFMAADVVKQHATLFSLGLVLSFLFWAGRYLEPAAMKGINSLTLWLRILVVGPYAIHFAIPAEYSGFRLQAYGYRFV